MEEKKVQFKLSGGDIDGGNYEVSIEGNSYIPFFNDDLKLKIAMELIETCDIKNFADNNRLEEYQQFIDDLKTAVDHFQEIY